MAPLALPSNTSATVVRVTSLSADRAWLAAPVPLPPQPMRPSLRGLLLGADLAIWGKLREAAPANVPAFRKNFLRFNKDLSEF